MRMLPQIATTIPMNEDQRLRFSSESSERKYSSGFDGRAEDGTVDDERPMMDYGDGGGGSCRSSDMYCSR